MSKDFFEIGVVDSFQPLAIRAELPLRKLHDGVYELVGKEFVMRIRRGTGHGKDFLVTLSRREDVSDNPLELTGEVGLAVLAEYGGATADALALTARDGSPGAFRRAAEAAERFCLPYLLGRRIDFADIQQFVEDKIQKSGAYTRKYHFPPNVREEWI
jgi:hypothetical protein